MGLLNPWAVESLSCSVTSLPVWGMAIAGKNLQKTVASATRSKTGKFTHIALTFAYPTIQVESCTDQ